MAPKIPFKVNSAGRWINIKTGRFAKKVDYLPYLEKKLTANVARAAGVKDYWNAVKVVMKVNKITNVKEGRSKLTEEIAELKQIYSGLKKYAGVDPKEQKRYTIQDDKHARKLLMSTKKYTDDSKKVSLHQLWEQFRAQKATPEQRKEVFSVLEDEGCELIS